MTLFLLIYFTLGIFYHWFSEVPYFANPFVEWFVDMLMLGCFERLVLAGTLTYILGGF